MSDGAYGSYGSIDVSDIDIGAIYLADVDAATTVQEIVVYAPPKSTPSGIETYVYAVPVQTITAVNLSNIAADCTITPVSNTTVTVNGVTYHQSTTTTTVKYGGVTETDTTITTTASNGASSTEYLSTYSTGLGNLTTDTAIINYPDGGQAVVSTSSLDSPGAFNTGGSLMLLAPVTDGLAGVAGAILIAGGVVSNFTGDGVPVGATFDYYAPGAPSPYPR